MHHRLTVKSYFKPSIGTGDPKELGVPERGGLQLAGSLNRLWYELEPSIRREQLIPSTGILFLIMAVLVKINPASARSGLVVACECGCMSTASQSRRSLGISSDLPGHTCGTRTHLILIIILEFTQTVFQTEDGCRASSEPYYGVSGNSKHYGTLSLLKLLPCRW